MLTGTAQAWMEAITHRRTWDSSRDTGRVRAGFITLASTATRWPAPREFLDALPRIEQSAIGYEVKPLSPAEAHKRIDAIKAELVAREVDPAPAAEPATAGPLLAEVEADLRRHYDGKSAAAGPDA